MRNLCLKELVEIFCRTTYSDESPVTWYLPFPTQERGIVLCKLSEVGERKLEWWSALVAWEIAEGMRTGKNDENMLIVRLKKDSHVLRLEGISEDDCRFIAVKKPGEEKEEYTRNKPQGALGKKVKSYWELKNREGLLEVYKALCENLGDGQRYLSLEMEHLRNTMFDSLWIKASGMMRSKVINQSALGEEHRSGAQAYFSFLLSSEEDSLWRLMVERLTKLACEAPPEEAKQWGTLLKCVDDAGNDESRLAVLAALVLLALNAGEVLKQPETCRNYETIVLSALVRQLEKLVEKQPEKQNEKQLDLPPVDPMPEPERESEQPKVQSPVPENAEENVQELSDNLLERIRARRCALNPNVPMPVIERSVVRAAKSSPETQQNREPEQKLPDELQRRILKRLDSLNIGREAQEETGIERVL